MKHTASLLAIGGCCALLAPAFAQAPPGPLPGGAPMMGANSVALPGDMIGSGMRMGPPPGMKPGAPPPGGMRGLRSDAPAPALAVAMEAAEEALASCKAQGFNIGVAVVGSDGQPRVGLSEDSASGGLIYTAVRKDLVALAFGMPSGKVDPADPKVTRKMAAAAGAIPLYSKGKLIGAIAGSGAASTQDEKCAQAGADAVKGQL